MSAETLQIKVDKNLKVIFPLRKLDCIDQNTIAVLDEDAGILEVTILEGFEVAAVMAELNKITGVEIIQEGTTTN